MLLSIESAQTSHNCSLMSLGKVNLFNGTSFFKLSQIFAHLARPWTWTNNLWRWSSCVLDVLTCKAPLPSANCHFENSQIHSLSLQPCNTHKTWQRHYFTPIMFLTILQVIQILYFCCNIQTPYPKSAICFYHSLFLGLGRGAWSLNKVGILLQWRTYPSLIWMLVNWGPQLMLQELLAPHGF